MYSYKSGVKCTVKEGHKVQNAEATSYNANIMLRLGETCSLHDT